MTDPAAHEARQEPDGPMVFLAMLRQYEDEPHEIIQALVEDPSLLVWAREGLAEMAASRAQLEQTREQFNWIKREAYGDNQAMRIIHACDVALDALAVIPDPEEAPT